jgi:hypothetical protein
MRHLSVSMWVGPASMASQMNIRVAREDEAWAVLQLWQDAKVTPPSVSDSIEGLTGLMPGG